VIDHAARTTPGRLARPCWCHASSTCRTHHANHEFRTRDGAASTASPSYRRAAVGTTRRLRTSLRESASGVAPRPKPRLLAECVSLGWASMPSDWGQARKRDDGVPTACSLPTSWVERAPRPHPGLVPRLYNAYLPLNPETSVKDRWY